MINDSFALNYSYNQIHDVFVHSIMYLLGFDEPQANILFKSYYNNDDLDELRDILERKEREVTNDE